MSYTGGDPLKLEATHRRRIHESVIPQIADFLPQSRFGRQTSKNTNRPKRFATRAGRDRPTNAIPPTSSTARSAQITQKPRRATTHSGPRLKKENPLRHFPRAPLANCSTQITLADNSNGGTAPRPRIRSRRTRSKHTINPILKSLGYRHSNCTTRRFRNGDSSAVCLGLFASRKLSGGGNTNTPQDVEKRECTKSRKNNKPTTTTSTRGPSRRRHIVHYNLIAKETFGTPSGSQHVVAASRM